MLNNPYASPDSAVDDVVSSDGPYQPRIFALHGRLGRVRYMAYISVCWLFTVVAISLVTAVYIPLLHGDAKDPLFHLLTIVMYLPMLFYAFVLAKRRLHDVNRSGKLSVLLLVPLLNFAVSLYLLFASGTDGDNDYGPPAVPNTTALVIGGAILPVVMIVGILAAVAIPAYSDYVAKAKAASSHSPM